MTYRAALVTGASSGIGRALSHALGAQKTHVVLAARRQPQLDAVLAELRAAGASAETLVLDVADTERTVAAIRALDDALAARGTPLDLVIANAGVGVGDSRAGASYAWESVRAMCHVNFCGALATITAALPQMVARGRGHVVGISSLAAYGALPDSAGYCAPKAGLSMFLECLRLDLADSGVAATTVHVGFVDTPMTQKSTHPMPQKLPVEVAAQRIVDALPNQPPEINFPQPLSAVTSLFQKLPRGLRHLVWQQSQLRPK